MRHRSGRTVSSLPALWRRLLRLQPAPVRPTYWIQGPGDGGHTWASGISPRLAESLFADLGGYLKLAQRGEVWPDTPERRSPEQEADGSSGQVATLDHQLADATAGPR